MQKPGARKKACAEAQAHDFKSKRCYRRDAGENAWAKPFSNVGNAPEPGPPTLLRIGTSFGACRGISQRVEYGSATIASSAGHGSRIGRTFPIIATPWPQGKAHRSHGVTTGVDGRRNPLWSISFCRIGCWGSVGGPSLQAWGTRTIDGFASRKAKSLSQ